MKVYGLRVGENEACDTYRIEHPIEYARKAGLIEGEISSDLPADATIDVDGTVNVHKVNVEADVIIFQRPARRAFVDAIRQAQKQGIACVVEIDDDLSSIDPDNHAYSALNGTQEHWKYLVQAAEIADWVTVSTPALARRYAPHGRVTVLRNVLPSWIFNIKKTHADKPRIGWSGSIASHPHDLEVLGVHLRTVMRETRTPFWLLGDEDGVRQQLRLDQGDTFVAQNWVPIHKYYHELARCVDVGIVPLQLTKFNEAKSYLKGLEMAGLGIPFVASPTPEYLHLSSLGAGVVARKGLQWQKELKRLVSDGDYLLEKSSQIRDAVRELTFENSVEAWNHAWLSAVSHRRASRTI